MREQIVWTAFLRVDDEAAARKLVARVQEALGEAVRVAALEPYWKDGALYRCVFTTPLGCDRDGDAVIATLRQAGRLARSWRVGGFQLLDDWWGWASEKLVVAGVESLGFEFGADAVRTRERRTG